jgi:hypothetical protein
MGRRNGESGERNSDTDLLCRGRGGVVGAARARGGGGGGGARSDFRRKKVAGLTDRLGPPVSEGEATGRLGQKGREEVGHGWAEKGGRRPGRIQNSKRKSILIDFWIKIGLEIE